MAQVNISLPPALKEWLDRMVEEGRYASASDYVRELIRREQDNADKLARLRAAIDQAWDAPVSERSLRDIYEANRTRRDAA
ncbi:type II toxin-antitoxin system ParD family antitoxin [Sphingomonas sp. RT2P30]|uniref:type II toxin-antitoxin system ParD family antitoxin n=1 Tax=Parasphingomonas halimpatiens TaxID=3096162 RepID=UPI002FCB115F